MIKQFFLLTVTLLMVSVSTSHAATAKIRGLVTKTVIADEGRWGGCMIKMNQTLADAGLNCPASWVTFSCSGVYTEKDVAYRMFDQAQMAFALGREVEVYVDDKKKHNDYCYGKRINVLRYTNP